MTLTDDDVTSTPLGVRASAGTVTAPTAFTVTASCPFCNWTQTKTFTARDGRFESMFTAIPAEPLPVNYRPRLADDQVSLDRNGRLSISDKLLAAAGLGPAVTRCTVSTGKVGRDRTVYIRLCRPGDWPDSERIITRQSGRARVRLGAALISLGFSPRRRPVGRYPASVVHIHGYPVVAICFSRPERDSAQPDRVERADPGGTR